MADPSFYPKPRLAIQGGGEVLHSHPREKPSWGRRANRALHPISRAGSERGMLSCEPAHRTCDIDLSEMKEISNGLKTQTCSGLVKKLMTKLCSNLDPSKVKGDVPMYRRSTRNPKTSCSPDPRGRDSQTSEGSAAEPKTSQETPPLSRSL